MGGCLSLSLTCVLLFFIFTSRVSSSSSSSFVGPQCHPDERSALIQLNSSFSTIISLFYYCAHYPNETLAKTPSWNENTNCCTWGGITCDNVTGHVIGLDLSCSNLQGPISSNSGLFFLRHLRRLVLTQIDFQGSPILPEFGQFKNLTYLDLSGSNFSGLVPLEIAHLSELVSLNISAFDDGQITIEDGTFKALAKNLTNLRELNLYAIDMSSISPVSLMNMSSLTHLYLSSTKLRGELPANVFLMPKLEVLVLARNALTGQIPCSFLNVGRLQTLDLRDNYFIGQIPEVCSNLSQKTSSYGSSKYPAGGVPSSLAVLNLFGNSLNGTIPSWIYELPYLEELDLSYCHFTGEIAGFRSTSLRSLSLRQNKLHGIIPRSIFQQAELAALDLSSNNITGTVELEELSKLKKLESVYLSSNNLSLSYNNSINYTLDNLYSLGLSYCNISEFPQFLRYSKGLLDLDLSCNQIQGSVPKWLWEVSKDSMINLNLSHNFLTHIEPLPWNELRSLDLRSNRFSGPFPSLLAPLLQYFFASENQIVGEIPTSICAMMQLEIVDLSHNNLSGNIPQCMGNFSRSLSVVDLRMNKLHGPIPAIFMEGNSLRSINLNGNQLEGPLPRYLVRCKYLKVLDLGNNLLEDTFPDWLESLPWLQILVLRANRFYGSIGNPNTSSPFAELRIMDISYNEFRGALPIRYIENFKAMVDADKVNMEYMGASNYYFDSIMVTMKGLDFELVKILTILTTIDFSSNNFIGEIPKTIGRLKSLKGLNFSHNKLRGVIPSSLGNLTNLEWLDLSFNELGGRIPDQLVGLTWLSFLNLSQNELVGPIPSGEQFNTFNNDSYRGNLGLCGFPLSESCNKDEGGQQDEGDDDDDGEHNSGIFDWKVVMMGYGSGMVIGISVGYMVFFGRSFDYWLMKRIRREPHHISIAPLRGRGRN